jgi:hypothetical protein
MRARLPVSLVASTEFRNGVPQLHARYVSILTRLVVC